MGARRALLAGVALLLAGARRRCARSSRTADPQQGGAQATALSLDDALLLGGRVSHTVKTAEAGVLRARGGQYQARSQYLPQVNGSIAYQRTLESQFAAIAGSASADTTTKTGSSGSSSGGTNSLQSIEKIFAAPNTMILGVTLSQNLFTAGRAECGAMQGAAAARTTADIGLDAARAQVSLDVAQAYFNAVASDKLVEIEDSTLAQAERTLQQTTVSREVGAAAEFDLLRARVARDNQRPVVIQAKSNRDIAFLRLRQLLGISLTQPLTLTTSIRDEGVADSVPRPVQLNQPITMPGGDRGVVPDTSVNGRSSVRQAEANITAQEYALRAARWERLPSAQLSSTYQRYGYPTDAAFVQNTFGTYYPELDGLDGALGAALPRRQAHRGPDGRGGEPREARQSLDQVRELAALDARTALALLEEADASYAASVGTDTQAARAYAIAEVRFQEGISTQVELQQSQNTVRAGAAEPGAGGARPGGGAPPGGAPEGLAGRLDAGARETDSGDPCRDRDTHADMRHSLQEHTDAPSAPNACHRRPPSRWRHAERPARCAAAGPAAVTVGPEAITVISVRRSTAVPRSQDRWWRTRPRRSAPRCRAPWSPCSPSRARTWRRARRWPVWMTPCRAMRFSRQRAR